MDQGLAGFDLNFLMGKCRQMYYEATIFFIDSTHLYSSRTSVSVCLVIPTPAPPQNVFSSEFPAPRTPIPFISI